MLEAFPLILMGPDGRLEPRRPAADHPRPPWRRPWLSRVLLRLARWAGRRA